MKTVKHMMEAKLKTIINKETIKITKLILAFLKEIVFLTYSI
jgi:hypothetical protein